MKIGQYCQRQRCRHAELKQFRQAFASRGFVSDSWAFLLGLALHNAHPNSDDVTKFQGDRPRELGDRGAK